MPHTLGCLQVESLLEQGADAAFQDTADGRSPLMAAAANGHVDVVKAILAAGAPWNAFDRQANCAGDYALLNNQQECVDALLNAGDSLHIVLCSSHESGHD